MIIGNGLIAKAFKNSSVDTDDIIIFASGISNSLENDINQYDRERELLLKTINENKQKKIIYFSSILTNFIENKYYTHKLLMESLIINTANNYLIFRLPQLIGELGNQNNIINTLKHKILNDETITAYINVKRSIMDIDDAVKICEYCVLNNKNGVINISGIEKKTTLSIVSIISSLLKVPYRVKFIQPPYNMNWVLSNDEIVQEYINNHIDTFNYTDRTLKKYI